MSEEIVHGYRLSPQQKRLWALQCGVFWSRCLVKIAGRTDLDALEKAIYRVVEEHEILRTTFTVLPGMTVPVQVIHPDSPGCVRRHDLTRLSEEERQRQVSDLYSTPADLPVDALPLFRCDLLELSHDEAVMLLKAPVICADLRSLENIASQVASFYAGETVTFGGMQYADFAEWHHELLESEEGRKYSTRQAPPAEVSIPFETRANESTLFDPQRVPVRLSSDVMKFAAAESGERWSAVVLACWRTLIQRLAGTSEITLGIACDGRRHPELVNSLGPYSRYVPLQIESSDELTILEMSDRLAQAKKQAAEWQEYFAWPDSESYFSVCFEERSVPPAIYECDAVEDRFKLRLVTWTTARLDLHYDAARFASHDIQRMADELATLIANAIRVPALISELGSLSHDERTRIVEGFNQTSETFPEECIHHLFEKQARQTPETVAVVCGSDQLTYTQLNQRANQLARYLHRLGIGPDVSVGLCLERSTDFVACMLAVMKAGGAYLPLDVNTPHERLATMLADTATPVLITRDARDRTIDGCRTLSLALIAGELAKEPTDDPISDVTTANLAYVIFTSGSTGRPKGVAVEHRQLCNYVYAIDHRVELSSCRSFAIVSTLVADLAHTMLFPSVLTGGTLHLIGEEQAASPDLLARYFSQNPIDCLKIVPTHLNALLTTARAAELLPRRHLILGGEACPRSLAEKIHEVASGVSVWNHYGPTETTVGCIAQQLTLDDTSTITIGRPLSNNTAYILNEHLRPVSIGVTGELYVGGEGVARGYLNRPELTAERFIPDPFSKEPGRRLYSTGDRARYSSDGRIEILGRVDHQLKVRGYRIEPEEIQVALNAHPLVSQSVVVGREDPRADKRLVAYIVATDSTQPAVKDLREFLGRRLPEYMVPSSFVFLKALPVTRNGKLDRDALPPPQTDGGEKQFVPPRTPVEAELCRIWTTVLGLQQVSINDNFFDLGGDSILAIQIIARANQAGMSLEPRQIFQYQTITELAAVAKDGLRPEAEQETITGEVQLSPVQAHFFELDLPDPHYYNQARLLKLSQPLAPEFLRSAVAHLLLHHDALRLRFFCSGEKWTQVSSEPEAAVPFERIDISQDAKIDDVLRAHAARIHASLNLQEGPIIRVALFDGAASYLLIVIHHLAVDTISWSVLLEDLETAYTRLSAGEEVSLPRKTTSFKSWMQQLAQFARSSGVEPEIDYWTSRPALSVKNLTRDHAGPNTVASRRTISVSLSPAETRSVLQDLPAKHRTQINEVLLAAVARTFTAWTKTPSVLIDLEGHGREQILDGVDLARTVGWFTSIFPVVLDLGKSSKSLEALRTVKEQLRAVPNRGIGYGLLRYLSGRKEVVDRLSNLPQAEVRFNYLGQQDRSLSSSRLFVSTHDSGAEAQSLRGERAYLLNIIASVSDGQLRFNWTYSENVHARETIERLAETTLAELRALLGEGETSDSVYAPSDFPKAKLTQKDLNTILSKLRT